ncbi:MAG TPA: prenyltransferase/squalene oxidase repeat-containing protein, partial [Pseudogracilibacillus sp.]|nr:prenyltransferase/squalene oxidase repeat-containing protein [Pseudogracilibacillus sp.]
GGDPTDIGHDNGKPINLIVDGTFNRGDTTSLGKQGLNGWIWGLITIDSMRYEVPEDAHDTRRSIIEEIIKVQLPDGGFSLNQPESDPDMTAMAIQALAPYYNSEETYTYQLTSTNEKVTKKVRTVINEAVEQLSELQLDTGDFESMGTPNAESTAQVIVALTALGIDPLTDERFIKNQDLFQGIMTYVRDDGGFIHSETYDPDNPSSHPNESNTMSSEQVLYALTALYRHREGYRTLYDFRPEMEEKLREQVDSTKESIDQIPENITSSDRKTIEKAFSKYKNIPVEERSYVYNYTKLAKAMDELEIENSSEPITENIGINKDGQGTITPLFNKQEIDMSETTFSYEDKAKAKAIPDNITTEYYVEVVSLIDKLTHADNLKGNEELLENLQKKRDQIEKIEAEIDILNQTIVKDLYPFNEIGIKDRKKVKKIVQHYQDLSSYDQQKIQNYNDVLRAETQINNMIRARVITGIVILVIGAVAVLYIIHVRKRRIRKRQYKMTLNQDG